MRPIQNPGSLAQTAGVPLHSQGAISAGHGNLKDEIRRLRSHASPHSSLDGLITKLSENPQAVLDDGGKNLLVTICMFHGEFKLLSLLLEQQPLAELTLFDRGADAMSSALETLLNAMPRDGSIRGLVLLAVKLGNNECALLFQVLNRIKANSLRLINCTVTIEPHIGLPHCPPLPTLEHLHLDMECHAAPFLQRVLGASQPSVLSLRSSLSSSLDLEVEQHRDVAQALLKQAKLRELKLEFSNGESLHSVIRLYADFLRSQATLEHLSFSATPLSSDDCDQLWGALWGKPLNRLSLSYCWGGGLGEEAPEQAAKLCGLSSLIHIDYLSNGSCSESVLATLASHPTLQYLDLDGNSFPTSVLSKFGSDLAANTILVSMQLPFMSDADFGCLAAAMNGNRSLRYLSCTLLENRRAGMNPEKFRQQFKGYSSLVECVAINKRNYELAPLMVGGMRQVLAGLGQNRIGSAVPGDVAHYAASIASKILEPYEMKALAIVDKAAAQVASDARARMQAEPRERGKPSQERDKH